MMRNKPETACGQVRYYYYDYLDQQTRKDIPRSDLEHIAGCSHCLGEVERLKAALAEAKLPAADGQVRRNISVIGALEAHFGHVGLPVSCSAARAFLPSLAMPGLSIRIPTPITTHLDKCPACSNDLSAIIGLGLDFRQLPRLARLLTQEPADDPGRCSHAQADIAAAAAMHFERIDPDTLEHLCTCPDCRQSVYEQRQKIYACLPSEKTAQPGLSCENVGTAEIFDCCVPFGINPAKWQDQSLASHLHACPACLARIRQMHETIYGIAERPDSEIVTRYSFLEQGEPQSDDMYADWQVSVELLGKADSEPLAAPAAIQFEPVRKEKAAAKRKLRRLLAPAATAAVILFAFAFFFGTPARAVELSQIYDALAKITNVCITSLVPGETAPRQQQWVSRTARIRLFKDPNRSDLWDFGNGVKKTRTSDSAAVELASISASTVAGGLQALEGACGLVPFDELKAIPENARWGRVDDKDIRTVIAGTEVYDLVWRVEEEKSFNKWRVYVDRDTNLPARTERYYRMDKEPEYRLEGINVVSYLTDDEIQAVIHSMF